MPHKALFRGAATLLSIAMIAATPAWALDEQKGEQAAIDACEKKLCTMLLQKNPKGDDLKCELTKTWVKSTIKEAENGSVTWGYGDARCTVDLNVTRAAVISAVSGAKYTYEVPMHTANCVVEQDGQVSRVTAKLSPKIVFRDGKAEKIWINLKDVDGPGSIKATIWTAARLADIGLFHRQMIKATNKFIERGCAKKYPQIASAAGIPVKEKVKKAKPEEKEKPAQAPTK
jgi:hypothetical protein